jgi:hypothetical protein
MCVLHVHSKEQVELPVVEQHKHQVKANAPDRLGDGRMIGHQKKKREQSAHATVPIIQSYALSAPPAGRECGRCSSNLGCLTAPKRFSDRASAPTVNPATSRSPEGIECVWLRAHSEIDSVDHVRRMESRFPMTDPLVRERLPKKLGHDDGHNHASLSY